MHQSITTDDVYVDTDTYHNDDGEPYTVVTITPKFDEVQNFVVLVDDMDAYRFGEFV